jgi:hypothetical protein
MTEEQIIEGNKLIAEFMGKSIYPRNWNDENWEGERRDYMPHEVKYHASYDWLIPVCFKIKEICNSIQDAKLVQIASSYLSNICIANNRFVINELYPAVVNFLKWYKQLKFKDGTDKMIPCYQNDTDEDVFEERITNVASRQAELLGCLSTPVQDNITPLSLYGGE